MKAVTIAAENARAYTVQRIVEALPTIMDAVLALAKEGDRGACEYLLNRLLGKPTERVESKSETTVTAAADAETLNQAAELLKSLGLARAVHSVLPPQPDTAPDGVPPDR